MRRVFFVLLVVIPLTGILAQENYEPGVILLQVRQPEVVRFSNGQVINGSSQLQAVFQQYPAIRSRKLSHVNAETDGCYRIEFPLTFPLASIQSALTACPDIKIVTLNHYGILAGTPNDPLWTDQWALQKIQMPNAWDVTKPSSIILVGIMDTGLDYTHVDLTDNVWINPNEIAGNGVDDDGNGYIDDIRGWDFVFSDNDPQESFLDHGTRVAGVIAARTYNGIGLAGIAGGWQSQVGVRLIGLKIVNDSGIWFEDEAKEAIDYLTWLKQQYGYTIIANMSIQTTGVTDEPMPLFQASVNAARDAGVIMVAAAGNVVNDPKSPYQQPAVIVLPIPARYSGVLAIGASQDGATLQDERRSDYSLYEGEGKLLAVAPVDKTPSLNVVTTFPGNQYYWIFNGTSAACPIVVGVVALMLTINPMLTYQQISDILGGTAEKIGNYTYDLIGRTDEVGYGRINAYQALLLTHSYSNKSMSATATATNSGRRLVKTSDGKYHLVFESGITSGGNVLSEIFYHNSTDGVNWSTPVRLSAGNEQNRYPSITERSGKLYVIWQRKTGTNTFDIHFRHFNGSSWEIVRNVTTGISGDPIPVIAISTPSAGFEMMVAYRTGSGLKSKRSTSTSGSTWETEKTITTNTSGRNPSLVYKQGTGFLVTWDNLNTVYYQAYNGSSWGSATNVSGPAGSSSSYSTESSIALAGNLDRYIAWKAEDPQLGDYVEVVFHNKNLNPSVFTEFADLYGYQYIRPSITGHDNAVASLMWQKKIGYTPVDVRKARYNGSSWDTNPEGTVVASGGFYPSVSIQDPPGGTAHAVWMTGSNTPYTINFGPQGGLSKSAEVEPVAYHRRIIYQLPSSKSVLSVLMSEVQIKNTTGEKAALAFPIVSDNEPVAVADLKSTLTFHSINLPTNADSLLFDARLYSREADSLRSDIKASLKLRFELAESANGSPVLVGSTMTFPDTGKYRQQLRIGMAVRAFANRNLTLRPVIENLKDKDLQGAVVHVYAFGGSDAQKPFISSPSNVIEPALSLRTYPNPFNPTTQIRFKLPAAGAVSLRIYDVNGRLIRELSQEQFSAGEHTISWDGIDRHGLPVSSGMYFAELVFGKARSVTKLALIR
jgi:hypothetical protein